MSRINTRYFLSPAPLYSEEKSTEVERLEKNIRKAPLFDNYDLESVRECCLNELYFRLENSLKIFILDSLTSRGKKIKIKIK